MDRVAEHVLKNPARVRVRQGPQLAAVPALELAGRDRHLRQLFFAFLIGELPGRALNCTANVSYRCQCLAVIRVRKSVGSPGIASSLARA